MSSIAYNTSSEEYIRALKNWGPEPLTKPELFHIHWLQYEKQPKYVLIGFGMLVAVIGVFSVLGNGLVCFTFLRSPTFRAKKLFVINVAFSDFISPLTTYHLFVINCFKGIWIFSKKVCIAYALIQGFCGLISIVSLAAIALERHAAIFAPHSRFHRISFKKKFKYVVFIWIYCFLAVCPPLIGIGDYVSAGFLTTCCFDYIKRDWKTRAFIMYLFTMGLGVPMMVIIYCYIQIGRAAQRSEQGYIEERFVLSRTSTFSGPSRELEDGGYTEEDTIQLSRKTSPKRAPSVDISTRETWETDDGKWLVNEGVQTTKDTVFTTKGPMKRMPTLQTLEGAISQLVTLNKHIANLGEELHDQDDKAKSNIPEDMEIQIIVKPKFTKQDSFWKRRNIRKDLRVAKMMFIVIVCFVIAWVPYGVVALIGQFAPRGWQVTPWMAMIPSVFAKSSTLYNPILYAYKDMRFKRGIRKYVFRQPQALLEASMSATTQAATGAGKDIRKEVKNLIEQETV